MVKPLPMKLPALTMIIAVTSYGLSYSQVAHNLSQQQLYDKLAELDSMMFAVIYTCDYHKNAQYYTENVEFLHDKAGLMATSRAQLMEISKKFCARIQEIQLTRKLLPATLQVFPLENYGAIQMGEHLMYIRSKEKETTTVEKAKFIKIWKYANGNWQVARVISYDHQDVPDNR
jgi:hypothetical protein